MKATFLALALLAGCAVPGHARDLQQACSSIAASAQAAGLTALVEAVTLAGLTETLSNPDANLTVFAPSNEGFTKSLGLLGVPGITAQTLQNQGLLAPILKNHVVMGAHTLAQLDQLKTVQSLDEQSLKISGKSVTTGSGNKANIAMPDVQACKSYVHVIDAVLVPQLTGLAKGG